MSELEHVFSRINKLFDACDRWLSDPSDPSRYQLGPRADDVDIIYWEDSNDGTPIKRKEKLSVLLYKVNTANKESLTFELAEIKNVDPSALLIKTANHLQRQLELIAKLRGELQDQTTVNVLITHPEWLSLRTAVLNALEPYPEARYVVIEAINERINE
jgi:hypothetical protein